MTQPTTAPFVQLPQGYNPHRPDLIIKRVLQHTGVSRAQLMSRYKGRHVKDARFIAAAMLQHYCHLRLVQIAPILYYKEHTAVLHAISTLKNWVQTGDPIIHTLKSLAPEMLQAWEDNS